MAPPKVATGQRGRGRPAGRGRRKAARVYVEPAELAEEPTSPLTLTTLDGVDAAAEVADNIAASEPPTNEMLQHETEVARLTAEVIKLRKENAELRSDLSSLRGMGNVVGSAKASSKVKPQAEQEVLGAVRRELAALVARFSVLEGIILRPPLAPGGERHASSYATATDRINSSARVDGGNANLAPVTSNTVVPRALTRFDDGTALSATALASQRDHTKSTRPADFEWEIAGAKKAAKNARKKKLRNAKKAAKKEAARLRAPKTSAVVVTLQPGAEQKGASYRDVLTKVRSVVDLGELGIPEGVRLRVTRTGARMLEVPGSTSGPIADALAEKLRASLDSQVVRISRPTKCADMRIVGLDDSVTVEEVAAAVARTGGCEIGQVKSGPIRPGPFGLGTVVVTCPVTAATKVMESRRILVGWVSAQVKLLDPRPLRCYRCLTGQHVGAKCTSAVDRSDCCFRCGQSGHKAGLCNAPPHCIICAEAGMPADHRAGGRACLAPTKPKAVATSNRVTPATITAAAATAVLDRVSAKSVTASTSAKDTDLVRAAMEFQ